MPQAPPGWYPSPDGSLRWWNGEQWADPPAPTTDGGSGLPAGRSRRAGKAVSAVALVVVAAAFVSSEVQARRADTTARPVALVSDPADGCRRFMSLTTGLLRDKPNDAEAARRFEQLRDAARQNDVLLASDLQNILDGDAAADVSAASQIILRRCGAAGHITQDEIDRLGADAVLAAGGSATAVPSPTAGAPVPAGAASVEEEDPTLAGSDTLSTAEPTCVEVFPFLSRHPNDMRAWLERYGGSGIAGSPWAVADYITLRSVSTESGDPIRQTLTYSDSLLNDVDLDDEALDNNDIPNRVLVYLEAGALACADGP